jgi:protein-disulfide isomerase
MCVVRAAFVLAVVMLVSVSGARAQTPACELPRESEVVGAVAGQPITRADAEAVWRSKDPGTFFSFQRQRYEMTMHAMQEIVAEKLLQHEATRRGTTVDGLIATEVAARSKPIPDEAVAKEFERMKTAFPFASLAEARPMVLSSMTQRQASEARLAFVNDLLAESSGLVETFDKGPRQVVPIDADDPSSGPEDAPLTLVVFSDFECPYCQQAEPVLASLQHTFSGQLRLVWKDFPLPIHQNARAAAVAARCADDQAAFWKYRDELFGNQANLSREQFRRLAASLGLDGDAFDACLASDRFEAVIDAKVDEGRALGVNSTPTMFINGTAVTGAVPLARLESMLREELQLQRR